MSTPGYRVPGDEPSGKDGYWYQSEVPALSDAALSVFIDYCGLQRDAVNDHIFAIRERAWKIHPYPCIGRYRFLNFALSRRSQYPDIVERLKSGQKLLDLGCCFGHDIRKLVHDGAPAGNLVGVDLQKDFIELGYDLFLDRETLSTKFFVADIFDMGTTQLEDMAGQIDIVHIGSFLHLFSWEKQRQAAGHISTLLKSSAGSLILGGQVGSTEPGEYLLRSGSKGTMYRHDSASFEKLWSEVEPPLGFRWKIAFSFLEDGSYLPLTNAPEDQSSTSSGKRFAFSVELVS